MNLYYTTTECLGRHYEVEVEYGMDDKTVTILSASLLDNQGQSVVDLLPALDFRQLATLRRDVTNNRENLDLQFNKFFRKKDVA